MKQILIFSLTALIACNLFAQQNYEPLLVEGKEWRVHSRGSIGLMTDLNVYYKIDGDTLVGDRTYKKVFCHEEGTIDGKPVSSKVEPAYLMYEDGRKVYYVVTGKDNDPKLLYDFGLNPDESFGNTDYVLERIDTVAQSGQDYAKYLLTTSGQNRVTWIEGVGSTIDLLCSTEMLVGATMDLVSCTWPDGRQYVTEYGKKYLEEQDKDYEPFLVEGKEWRVHSRGSIGLMTDLNEYYKIDGDTLVGDRTYKKVYCHKEGTIDGKPVSSKEEPSYLMYEDGRKVYYVVTGKDNDPKLLYDFGLNPSESFGNTDYVLERIDTVAQSGQDYAKYSLTTSGQNTVTWIEGVGSTIDLLCSTEMLVGATMDLVSCTWPDGRQYITEYGKKYLEGIHSIKNEEMNNAIYDLQGRRVENPKQGEIYIQNGKKYINK